MNSRELIVLLEKEGWRKVSQKGSHVQFKHLYRDSRVTVPHPKKDLPKGTLKSIFRQMDYSFEEK